MWNTGGYWKQDWPKRERPNTAAGQPAPVVSVPAVVDELAESTAEVADAVELVTVESVVLVGPPVCEASVAMLVFESLEAPAVDLFGAKQAEMKQAAKSMGCCTRDRIVYLFLPYK